MSIFSKIRTQKHLPFAMLLGTLAIGILIGTLINTGVKADRGTAAPDATPLTIPSPVELQNEFTKLSFESAKLVVGWVQPSEQIERLIGTEKSVVAFFPRLN